MFLPYILNKYYCEERAPYNLLYTEETTKKEFGKKIKFKLK